MNDLDVEMLRSSATEVGCVTRSREAIDTTLRAFSSSGTLDQRIGESCCSGNLVSEWKLREAYQSHRTSDVFRHATGAWQGSRHPYRASSPFSAPTLQLPHDRDLAILKTLRPSATVRDPRRTPRVR